jgi:hypothetical protein
MKLKFCINFLITRLAIDSPDRYWSRSEPKYLTDFVDVIVESLHTIFSWSRDLNLGLDANKMDYFQDVTKVYYLWATYTTEIIGKLRGNILDVFTLAVVNYFLKV